MGGTTAKASLIEDAEVSRTTEYEVGASMNHATPFVTGTGHALKLPMIDIAEVGSGGGSIATVDRSGSLKVGPRSAACPRARLLWPRRVRTDGDGRERGARLHQPGPARRRQPHLAARTRGGRAERARGAAARALCASSGVRHPYRGQREHDPGDQVGVDEPGPGPARFRAVRLRGNGAVHAAAIAQEMGIRQVIVPPRTGVLSAVGLLEAASNTISCRRSYTRPRPCRSTGSTPPSPHWSNAPCARWAGAHRATR